MESTLIGKVLSDEDFSKLSDVGKVIKMSKQMFFFWMRSLVVW